MPFPALPSPRTWVNQSKIKATYLRQDVADAVALLTAPPFFAGAQTQASQGIGTGLPPGTTPTEIVLDTENADPQNMHQNGSAHPARVYPSLAGWYLCQAVAPLTATAGGGGAGACIEAVQGGGAVTHYGGQNLINGAGYAAAPVAAKLARISATGPYGTGDYAGPSMYQNAGSTIQTQVTAASFPRFSMRWVAALSGTEPLIVPPLQAAAVPPQYVTSAWLNTNIRDTINFLTYPPVGEWTFNAGGSTLFSATVLPLSSASGFAPFDTTVVDNYSALHIGTGSIATWTAPVAGRYFCYLMVSATTAATALAIGAGLNVTSANYFNGSQVNLWNGVQAAWPSQLNSCVFRRVLRLNKGDIIIPVAFYHDSAAASATIGGSPPLQSRLIIVWRGA